MIVACWTETDFGVRGTLGARADIYSRIRVEVKVVFVIA